MSLLLQIIFHSLLIFYLSMSLISPILPTQVLQLQQVMRETYLDHYQYLWDDRGENYISNLTQLEVLEKSLAHPNQAFYFIENNGGQTAGFMKLYLDSPIPETEYHNAMCLDKIYLRANAAGQGLGQLLLEKAVADAHALGRTHLWLRVMESSIEAQAFYRRAGFEIIGTAPLDLKYMKQQYRIIHTMLKSL